MSLLFRPLSERGIELCSKGLHEMVGDNVGVKRRGPLNKPSRTCRACNRETTLRRRAEQRAYKKETLNPLPSREHFECERWEEGGHLYVKVSSERFEYATIEDYTLKARRILGPHVRKTGWKGQAGVQWLEEVARERDYANPAWAHSITFRTIAPVLLTQPDHGAAA